MILSDIFALESPCGNSLKGEKKTAVKFACLTLHHTIVGRKL